MVHDALQAQIDNLHESTGVHFTLFYGDTRYVTSMVDSETGLRMEGTKASTEETNASMEELNSTFAVISDAAGDLREMAETLNEKMGYFTLELEGAES